jgi:polyvinyl alcohol dehydrogenase (cytochrome)
MVGIRGLSFILFAAVLSAQDGAALFQKSCAACHDAGANRAPRTEAIKQLSPEAVYTALTSGSMAGMGAALSAGEIRAIATSLTGKAFGASTMPQSVYCGGTPPALRNPLSGAYWNGWGADTANHRAQTAERAGLREADVARLKLKWAFAFPGVIRAFAQPTVAGGRIFVGSALRQVYSLNASTGCMYWFFETDFPVRTAISLGQIAGGGWAAYFGDQHGSAYAVDAATGKLIWKTHVEEHPGAVITGSPTLYNGRLYVPVSSIEEFLGAAPNYECCKFRGSVSALDAATGKVIWKTYTIAEEAKPTKKNKNGVQMWGPSGAGIWSSPTIDPQRGAVYVTTGDSYSDPAARTSDAFLALDLETGKLLWSRQLTEGDAFNVACALPGSPNCPDAKGPDFDFGQSAILVSLGGGKRALVAGQKSGMVHALDPDQQGEVLWSTRVGKGGNLGGVQWGSAADEHNVYAALSDFAFRPVLAPTEKSVKTDFGAVELDSASGGGLFAIRLADGKLAWSAPPPGCGSKPKCSPAQSAAVTLIPGVVFSGSVDGHLRAYATRDGKILWDVDTAHEFPAVNGAKGSGGSIDGPGPVVAGGMLYVNSGYGFVGQMPGNVLLAFSVDGK